MIPVAIDRPVRGIRIGSASIDIGALGFVQDMVAALERPARKKGILYS